MEHRASSPVRVAVAVAAAGALALVAGAGPSMVAGEAPAADDAAGAAAGGVLNLADPDAGIRTVAADEGHVYFGWGNRLVVAEATDPFPPRVVGLSTPFLAAVERIHLSGRTVYVALGQAGLALVDVTDPRSPRVVGRLDTRGRAVDVAAGNGYAYVADQYSGLVVVDVTSPSAPSAVATVHTRGSAIRVTVANGYAYVAGAENFSDETTVVDVTSPRSPRTVARIGEPEHPRDMIVLGGTLLVAGWHNTGGGSGEEAVDGVWAFDVAVPASPRPLGGFETTGIPDAIAADGTQAWLAGEDSEVGLYGLDYRDPAEPRFVARPWTGIGASDVAAAGGLVWLAERTGLRALDLSDPSAGREPGAYHLADPLMTGRLAPAGNALLVAYGLAGMQVVDVAGPVPRRLGTLTGGSQPLSVAVQGDLAVVGDAMGTSVADIGDPAGPRLLGRIDGLRAHDVAISGTLAAALTVTGTVLLDVSAPDAPRIASAVELHGAPTDVEFAGRLLVVTSANRSWQERGGLAVLDVTDPSRPTEATDLRVDADRGGYVDAVVIGSHVLAADEASGALWSFDIADPTRPAVAGASAEVADLRPAAMALAGDRAVVAGSQVAVFDVSDPAAPVVVSAVGPPYDATELCARDLVVADGRGHLLDCRWGVVALDLSSPDTVGFPPLPAPAGLQAPEARFVPWARRR